MKKYIFRHQVAALIGWGVDYTVLILCTEIFSIWYVTSTAVGGVFGALVNFFISSYWVFSKSKNSLKNQLFKYIIVTFGNLILNILFIYLLTDWVNIDYKISKIIAGITIAGLYNFLLMRYFVFKK
ncbi:MAG: polysaccharide biosynthesis protein GtrA [Flavobacteriales bacterium]|nr:MAG: polysaccharide biosynthesis protein GtrA [Flavobacteriales bacterium]